MNNQIGGRLVPHEITDDEYEVVKLMREIKPYGKIDIVYDTAGNRINATLTNPRRVSIKVL